MSSNKNLAVGLFCVDWRLHQPEVDIVGKVREHLGVEVIDVQSIPGPDGILKAGREGDRDAVLGWFKLLIGAHHPSTLAVIGHYDCAGNRADDAVHDSNSKEVVEFLKKETGFEGPIVALVATYTSDTEWGLKEVARA